MEEPCCGECVDNDEPCCVDDNVISVPEQLFVVPVTSKKFDVNDLARHLCCQNKFYIIYKVMDTLKKPELKKLRDGLRTYTKSNQLHPALETKFRRSIDG